MPRPEPQTLEQIHDRFRTLREMNRDLPCPKGCDEGWIPSGLCGGHLCDWEGHEPMTEGQG